MPKGRYTNSDKRGLAVRQAIVEEMPRKAIAEKLDVTPEDILKWEKEIVPDGSGLPANKNYEQMETADLQLEFERRQAVAKMYLIDRLVKLAPAEVDMAKVSGALKDLQKITADTPDTEGKETGWSDIVQGAIKDVIKKKGNITLIDKQQNNYGDKED